MRALLLTAALLIGTNGTATVSAQDGATAGEPTATIRFYTDSRMSGDWYGEGQLQISADFCAASSTGRFRLRIDPFGGLTGLGGGHGATATLTTDAGSSDTVALTGPTPFDLTGRNLASAIGCAAGPNAQLTITLPENALTAAQAGSYVDSLQFFIEPS